MSAPEPTIQTLYDALIFDLTKALALKRTRFANSVIQMMFGRAARRVAQLGIGLDGEVAHGGLPAGARWLLPIQSRTRGGDCPRGEVKFFLPRRARRF